MSNKTLTEIRAARKRLCDRIPAAIAEVVAEFEKEADISPESIRIGFVEVTKFCDERKKRVPDYAKVELEDI